MSALGARRPDDRVPAEVDRLRARIGAVLRTGVAASAAVTGLGLAMYLVERFSGYAHGGYPRHLAAEAAGLLAAKPYAVIAAGLLLLIATPIARVALSAAFFLRERDWPFLAITCTVLLILAASFALGARLP